MKQFTLFLTLFSSISVVSVFAGSNALAGCQTIEPKNYPWYDPRGWIPQNSSTFCTVEGGRIRGHWGTGARVGFRFCTENGYASGFPDGEEGRSGDRRVIGVNCINGSARYDVPSNISLF